MYAHLALSGARKDPWLASYDGLHRDNCGGVRERSTSRILGSGVHEVRGVQGVVQGMVLGVEMLVNCRSWGRRRCLSWVCLLCWSAESRAFHIDSWLFLVIVCRLHQAAPLFGIYIRVGLRTRVRRVASWTPGRKEHEAHKALESGRMPGECDPSNMLRLLADTRVTQVAYRTFTCSSRAVPLSTLPDGSQRITAVARWQTKEVADIPVRGSPPPCVPPYVHASRSFSTTACSCLS